MDAPRTRVQRRPVHGVLLLDKPLGLSSNNALQKCKWLLRAEKAGHTGTLDPLATGVLPLCFGAATKFGQMQLEADKTYEATIRLGVKTSTGDAEGEVVSERAVSALSDADLAEVAQRFTGTIRQTPPMHSALKKDGKALYEYARAGEEVEREAREVTIHTLSLSTMDPTHLRLVAKVSKGTYIRTLGEDIGEALGCGGHLTSLRRTATGQFGLAQCVILPALEAMDERQRAAALLPVDALLPDHTRISLSPEDAGRFLSGLRRRGSWPDTEDVAVFAPSLSGGGLGWGRMASEAPPTQPPPEGGRSEILLGTAHIKAGELIPGRLLAPTEIQQILQGTS
jgi:tRNA pseudouridine55 synthase